VHYVGFTVLIYYDAQSTKLWLFCVFLASSVVISKIRIQLQLSDLSQNIKIKCCYCYCTKLNRSQYYIHKTQRIMTEIEL
jgi:hypothetical protein